MTTTVANLVEGPQPAAADWSALGTSVRLLVTDPARLADARVLLVEELDAIDLACSRFRDDSEIVRLQDAPPGTPVAVSDLLAEAIEVALRAARLTDGLVDPTVGRAMESVGYDRDFAAITPSVGKVTLVAAAVPGWRRVELDRANGTVCLPEGVHLDLGATAKALASDRAAATIHERLGCGVLVDLGGDLAVRGTAPAGGWRIRVQDITGHPDDDVTGPTAVVAVKDGGLATSSTTARRWVHGGRTMHHIIDPSTAMPATSPWRTVSVAAASCVDANTASTAAIIRGASAAAWLQSLALPARLVRHDGHVVTVAGWPADPAPRATDDPPAVA